MIRPNGQFAGPGGGAAFGPEPSQDFELELGIFVGPGNAMGQPIGIDQAPGHLFGYCLLNDWSARAIQTWESRPLGPFLGKSLMTTISPWMVTAEALAPFAVPAREREPGDAAPAHLTAAENQDAGGIDIQMFADWSTAKMTLDGRPPDTVSAANFQVSYWTPAQMLTHHASNGCNLEPGDLFGSGTMSGPAESSRACLAELNGKGSTQLEIGGEERVWLKDGDSINFRARAVRGGFVSIGFGDCRGRVQSAVPWPAPS